MYKARLINQRGETVKTFDIAGKMPRILTAVADPIEITFDPDPSPIVPNTIRYVEFVYEGTDYWGTRIYRRVTPPWENEKS